MLIVVLLASTVLGLWAAETAGAAELEGWVGAFGAAWVYWLGTAGRNTVLGLLGYHPIAMPFLVQGAIAGLALELAWASVLLLLASVLLPGFRIRGVAGLLLVAGLVLAVQHGATALLRLTVAAL